MTTTWTTEIDAWATAMRAARRSPETIYLRTYHLGRLASWAGDRGPWTLTIDDLLTWTGRQRWGRETARSVRSSLRRFYSWGVLTGRTEADPAQALPVIAPTPPRPDPAPADDVAFAMLVAPSRERLMIRLANELCLRRGEVARGHSDDLSRDLAGWSLHVHGKGSRDRDIPLPDDLAVELRALGPGWFFPGAVDGHLSARWVGTLVKRDIGCRMHRLRHLGATELHEDTHDIRLVQEVLGHASLETTQRYVAVKPEKMRRAIAERSARWAA